MAQSVVAALYRFVTLEDYREMREPLLDLCRAHGVKGTLLLAQEGINGTIAGTRSGIDAVLGYLKSDPRLAQLEHKESLDDEMPFYRMKVKLKKEIVTMGVDGIDPNRVVGTYVKPADWNALINDPEVLLIDTRNDYECEIGSFRGALDPHTASFREFPAWWRANREAFEGKQVAMYCTGGIRCEKASSFLLGEGVEEVFHLKGGILKYLEETPKEDSLWDGECFVFDGRVSVGHGLKQGPYDLCHACRRPISAADKASPLYLPGVQCPHCVDEYTEADRSRFRQRQKQMELARQRGERHLGEPEA